MLKGGIKYILTNKYLPSQREEEGIGVSKLCIQIGIHNCAVPQPWRELVSLKSLKSDTGLVLFLLDR